jgi:tetratricopeptide (TPR) repeat protein
MTPEEAIQVADEVLFAHTGSPLTDIQRMILCESLAGKGYESMRGYAFQHIKNEGKNLWDLLSEALREKVSKPSFKGALEKRLKSGRMVSKPPQPSNYDEQTWAGREEAVKTLLPKLLQGQPRALWLTGISGIGKTALGECLASQAWKRDPSFQWIYLEILEGQSADFASIAAEILAKLGDCNLDPQQRNDPEQVAKRLLQKLRTHPYWIQIDALERLLDPEQSTEFVDDYWKTFLERYLTESSLVSRLILTAQALPAALIEFSDRYPNTWKDIRLRGLSKIDSWIEFFVKRGIIVEDSNRKILIRIAEIYEGHPLVLKVIAEDIQKEFSGKVFYYWQVNQRELEQVAMELQDSRLNETEYNEALDRKVRERIKKSLKKLPLDALDLLCSSSVLRYPVPKNFWLAMVRNLSSQRQKEAYRVLMDRALIENEGINIRQHNLIRSVAYDLLRREISNWQQVERHAAHLWLNIYQPTSDVSKLVILRGYLEAFYHYCECEEWELARDVILNPINLSEGVNVLQQLETWGLYQEGIYICQKIIKRTTLDTDTICFKMLGKYNLRSGDFLKAIDYYEKSLAINQDFNDNQKDNSNVNTADILVSLGLAHYFLGNYEKSIDICQQGLICSQKYGYRMEEGNALGNLGLAHYNLGHYVLAISYHQKALVISREIQNSRSEAYDLGNLGLVYLDLGQYEKAIDFLDQFLTISQNINDPWGESNALRQLGSAYCYLKQYDRALDFLQKSLVIKREIGDHSGEGVSLGTMGVVYFYLKQYERARDLLQQHLTIAQARNDAWSIGFALNNIGRVQLKLKKYPDSLTNHETALKIFREIGERTNEADVLRNLTELYIEMGETDKAQQFCQQALSLATELEIPIKQECEALQLQMQVTK